MPYDVSVLNDSFEITQPMTLSKCLAFLAVNDYRNPHNDGYVSVNQI